MISENTFICVSRINRFGICEVKEDIDLPENVSKEFPFTLHTKFDESIELESNQVYNLEIEKVERKVWIGKVKLTHNERW